MKREISAEDCEELCDLIYHVALGCEQGVQSYETLKKKAKELQEFMAARGHALHLAYLTE